MLAAILLKVLRTKSCANPISKSFADNLIIPSATGYIVCEREKRLGVNKRRYMFQECLCSRRTFCYYLALGLVGIQEGLWCHAMEDKGNLPCQVERVLQSRVHSL